MLLQASHIVAKQVFKESLRFRLSEGRTPLNAMLSNCDYDFNVDAKTNSLALVFGRAKTDV